MCYAEFARIHRSTIVNVERIRELRSPNQGDFRLRLNDGTELRLSRGRKEALERLLRRPADRA